ncbi:MAG: endonuclease domain-containing protein [Candidatus Komeilibacteria bacterium]
MTKLYNRHRFKSLRKDLRSSLPPAEIMLWLRLKGSQLNGYKFRRQHGIGKYVVDFYCPEVKLAIEIDGESHLVDGAEEMDNERQKYIELYGIKVIRFSNGEVYENTEEVIEIIKRHLNNGR